MRNAPQCIRLTARERYHSTDPGTHYALSVPELKRIQTTAPNQHVLDEHRRVGRDEEPLGLTFSMDVDAQRGDAFVNFRLLDNKRGRRARVDIRNGTRTQLSLSHNMDDFSFNEVSLVDQGGRPGTFINTLVNASKSGGSDKNFSTQYRLKTVTEPLQVMLKQPSDPMTNAMPQAAPAAQTSAQAQVPAQAPPRVPNATQTQSQSPEQNTDQEQTKKRKLEDGNADTGSSSTEASDIDTELQRIRGILSAHSKEISTSERSQLTKAFNKMLSANETLQDQLRQRKLEVFSGEVKNQCAPVFQAIAMEGKDQDQFVKNLTQAKNIQESFATVSPLLLRMAQQVSDQQARQNRPEHIMASQQLGTVNASARMIPESHNQDIAAFERKLQQRRKDVDLAYNCVSLPLRGGANYMPINASAASAPTTEPRNAAAMRGPNPLSEHLGEIFSMVP